MFLLDSRALTKVQSVALIAVIAVAAVVGGTVYFFWRENAPSTETIKIGLLGDLDWLGGKELLHAAMLAAEQVNAEGGVLGRNFTIVSEDDDSSMGDISVATNALTKLITVDNADYIVSPLMLMGFPYQDICADHKKILIAVGSNSDRLSQRVLDNHDKYKYFFSVMPNASSAVDGWVDAILTLRNYTGFNKVAYLDQDVSTFQEFRLAITESLSENGFDLVYQNSATWEVTDFTSYFSAIEAAGAEILFPLLYGSICTSFVKEWCDRQSPFVVWGTVGQAELSNFWELTDGKCEYVSFAGFPTMAGYPLTNQTVPFREAYLQRWNGEMPTSSGTLAYDAVRFILPDAIRRAGTTETEAVMKALETTNVETTTARHFVFTSSHDAMIGLAGPNKPSMDYTLVLLFQWQNGVQVPVYPKEVLDEAGTTYECPPWQGAWSD